MRNRILAFFLLFAVSGCLQTPIESPYPPACQGDGPEMWGALDARVAGNPGLESDPRKPWQTVAVMRGDPTFGFAVETGNASVSWIGNGSQRLAILEQQPPVGYLDLTITVDGVDCVRFTSPDWNVSPPREGALVEVGKGAVVHTAGFLEDGTLFYTNIHKIHDGVSYGTDGDVPWPRVPWYAYNGDDPLHVYVYDRDRSEIPPQWGAVGGLPIGEPAASTLPGRYFTTIPGFNEALKGMSTSTLTAVHIVPEDAYTRPGYEEHPLYGEALVFLIQVDAVADQPCSMAGLWSQIPNDQCFRK